MSEVGRSQTESGVEAQLNEDYLFELRPIQQGLFYREKVSISYAPVLNRDSRVESYLPCLNLDGKAYTPLFITPAEKDELKAADGQLLERFNQRLTEDEESEMALYVPKPSKTHSRCHVCKVVFEDYLEHVHSKAHLRNARSNGYSQHIRSMCEDFALERKRIEEEEEQQEQDMLIERELKRTRCIKRRRDYLFEEPACQQRKKRKLDLESQIENTPSVTDAMESEDPFSNGFSMVRSFLPPVSSFPRQLIQFSN